MLKANKRTLIITSIITILPIFVGLYFWKELPDVMATHFGTNNEADGFSSKAFAVFGLPLFLLAIHWFAAIVTTHDPKRRNISPKMFTLVLWIVPVISLFVATGTYLYNLGRQVNLSYIAMLFIGAVFVVIGNYLPKARQNYTIGIRIPWTLADETNWNRTHRMAGLLWMVTGLLIIILTLGGFAKASWMIAILLIVVFLPVLYSFVLYKKQKKETE